MAKKNVDPLFLIFLTFGLSIILVLALSSYEPFKKSTPLGLMACVSSLIVSLIQLPKYREILAQQETYQHEIGGPGPGHQLESGPRRYRLLNQLHSMTGDTQVSQRLIEAVQSKNPTQSRDWCVEKAIRDLERDRK